jgi:hypothetical protein
LSNLPENGGFRGFFAAAKFAGLWISSSGGAFSENRENESLAQRVARGAKIRRHRLPHPDHNEKGRRLAPAASRLSSAAAVGQ